MHFLFKELKAKAIFFYYLEILFIPSPLKSALFKQQRSSVESTIRLPEKICCSQRSSRAYMKFEHQISEGTFHTGPETEGRYCFYCTTLNFERKLPKTFTTR